MLSALNERAGLLPEPSPDTQTADGSQMKWRAHVALRALLAGAAGLATARQPFRVTPGGKPTLEPAPLAPPAGPREALHFSLAHCGDGALIALSRTGPIGTDLEFRRAVRIRAHRRALIEQASVVLTGQPLAPADADDRFLVAWVRLEAAAKATGEGIAALLRRLGARGAVQTAPDTETLAADGWAVTDLTVPGRPDAFAAVAQTSSILPNGETARATLVRELPLDPASLEALVSQNWSPFTFERPLT
ncbi:MAG: 4'-phosphopantetheinyl transferase family protein [Hyphomicrobiaceae bacterium]